MSTRYTSGTRQAVSNRRLTGKMERARFVGNVEAVGWTVLALVALGAAT